MSSDDGSPDDVLFGNLKNADDIDTTYSARNIAKLLRENPEICVIVHLHLQQPARGAYSGIDVGRFRKYESALGSVIQIDGIDRRR